MAPFELDWRGAIVMRYQLTAERLIVACQQEGLGGRRLLADARQGGRRHVTRAVGPGDAIRFVAHLEAVAVAAVAHAGQEVGVRRALHGEERAHRVERLGEKFDRSYVVASDESTEALIF